MKVDYSNFLRELQTEVKAHKEESTSWRKKVASLALVTALELGTLESFKVREDAVQAVANLFPTMDDKDLVEDIGKMLHTIYRDLDSKLNINAEVKQYVKQKKINQKPPGFKKPDGR